MRDDLRILLRLLRMARPHWRWMALGALCALLTVLANIGLMALAGWFIAAMAVAGAAGVLMNYLLPAAFIRLFAIVRTGGRYLERLTTHEATLRLLSELRVWFYVRVESLAPARLQPYRGADLLSRIQSDIDTLHHAYLRVAAPALVALVAVAAATVALAHYSGWAALVALLFLLLAGAAIPLAMRMAGERPGIVLVESRAALRSALVDTIQGMGELSVYGAASRQARAIDALTRSVSAQQMLLSRLAGLSEGAVGLCAGIAMWGTLLISISLVGDGHLHGPELPLVALLTLASFEVVGPLPLAFQRLGETLAAARRIFEIADAQPQIAPVLDTSPRPRDFTLAMRGVRLRYDERAAWALDGVDLELNPGRCVAIVGASGAGKSSIVRVALRFWEYQEGEIRLGGHDLRRYQPEDVRSLIAVVSQDTHLFNATIRDNLLLASPDAD